MKPDALTESIVEDVPTGVSGVRESTTDPFGRTRPAEASTGDRERPRAPWESAPARIQHYEIIRPLGKGGMGTVSLARDTRLGRLVAIKVLDKHSGDAARRFLIEARATAQISHENIVVIHELGEHDGKPYMVLEYLKGKTLGQILSERQDRWEDTAREAPSSGDVPSSGSGEIGLPPDRIVELMIPVVRALVCAHQHGIVHRDLKPSNILVTDTGVVKVLDFGIAKLLGTPDVEPTQDGPPAKPLTGSSSDANVLTKVGTFVGTMPYMSPEQWKSEGIDHRTDIWAVGIILAELVLGRHPLGHITMATLADVGDLELPMPSMRALAPNLGKLGSIIDRCLIKRLEDRLGSAEELLAELEGLIATRRRIATEEESPYVGLTAFKESDAERYYGRSRAVTEVATRLEEQPLLAIVGPSGAGKSSFVRAGVVPALHRGGESWEALTMRPGAHPLVAMAELLIARSYDTSIATMSFPTPDPEESMPLDRDRLAARLRREPGYFGTRLRARARRKLKRVLLLVDQLEELYTMAPEEDRAPFFACLAGAADDAGSPLRVILTIRSDFLDRVTEAHAAKIGLGRGMWLLPPMDRDGLREALGRPILDVGYRFEPPSLMEEMLDALEHTSGALPLLSFTAAKLWERRDRTARVLTEESYRDIGGIAGTLAGHGDAVLGAMSPEERKLSRAVLLRLVTPERTRAICTIGDLRELSSERADIERVLSRLIDARLLTVTGGDEADATVEIVHESLIAGWPALSRWVAENHVDGAFLARVRLAAREWEASGQSDDLLWRGQAAEDARRWYESYGGEIGRGEERFLEAMIALAERSRTVRRRIVGGTIGVLAVIATAVSWLAIRAEDAAELAREQATRAREEATRADQESARAQDEARRVRNAIRMLAARSEEGDPTLTFVVLREVEPPGLPPGWTQATRSMLQQGVARVVISQPEWPLAVAWSPDDRRVAVVSVDKKLWVWNADGTGEPRVFSGHEDEVRSVAWSSDGKRILTASKDKTARVWSADGQGEPLVIRGHEGPLTQAAWSHDGTRIATASADKTARVWSADAGRELAVFREHEGDVDAIAWSPDGKRIATGSKDKTTRLWSVDGKDATIVLSGHTDAVRSVAWSPNGERIATASKDETTRLWSADGKGEPRVFHTHKAMIYSVRWSPDGERIVTASGDGTARVWSADGKGESLLLRAHGSEFFGAAWSHDGRRIVTATSDATVRVWSADLMSQRLLLHGHEQFVLSVAWSPDGTRLASVSADGTARLWDTKTWREISVLRGHTARIHAAAWSPDGKRIVTTSWDKTARVWSADGKGEPLVFRAHTDNVFGAAWSPDGKRIATSSRDGTVRVWNPDGTGEPLVLHPKERVFSLAFSPNGRRIAGGSRDGSTWVWNADGHGEPLVLKGHTEWVYGVAWSPEGERIATASRDKTARIWRLDGKIPPLVLRGHEDWVYSASWSPDGKRLFTASTDRTVRGWNADGQSPSWIVFSSSSLFNFAALSPDGGRLAAASDDFTVWVTNDLEPIAGPNDGKLWTATTYCPSVEQRVKQFTIPDAVGKAQLDACVRRVEDARAH